jgi:ubiquinone/menaquinone biosynthesis C-methylase UbiE
VADEVRFDPDLYRGAAAAYDRYRLPYPTTMTDDLIRRARVAGGGRLLDLACGTGQLGFPMCQRFDEVWAVDQEPDMVEAVRAKAAAAGARNLRPVVSAAEALAAEPGYFELAVIGNAFHRLDRDLVAARVFGWLQPGGHLALCWSSQPWIGGQGWQQALAAALDRWKAALGAEHRIPAGWEEARSRRPDSEVLSDAGFELAASQEFVIEHRWTVPELAGLIRSTSFLPATVLGDQAAAFDADLGASLAPHSDDGAFTETVRFAYELARKPGAD